MEKGEKFVEVALTIKGDEYRDRSAFLRSLPGSSGKVNQKIKEIRRLDKTGTPMSRQLKDRLVPIYDVPSVIVWISKRSKSVIWDSIISVKKSFASDMNIANEQSREEICIDGRYEGREITRDIQVFCANRKPIG